jgi:hypothetical protein
MKATNEASRQRAYQAPTQRGIVSPKECCTPWFYDAKLKAQKLNGGNTVAVLEFTSPCEVCGQPRLCISCIFISIPQRIRFSPIKPSGQRAHM